MNDRAPDVIGEIVAWRAWELQTFRRYPPQLCSLGRGVGWPSRDWLRAECDGRGCDEPPGEGCTCGIYAARSLEHLVKLGYHGNQVLGEIALAGKVVRHEKGWRAERARPLRVSLPYEDWQHARALAEVYRITVRLHNADALNELAQVVGDGHHLSYEQLTGQEGVLSGDR